MSSTNSVIRSKSAETRAEELAGQARDIIRSREIHGVSRSSEEKVVSDAQARCDLIALHAIIDYGYSHQAGCIHRAATALREASRNGQYRVGLEHVEAAAAMIVAIISVVREDLSPMNAIRRQAFTDMADYAVTHHEESRTIATIVRERKVSSLRELIVIMNGIREIEAGVLGEGFI